VKVSSGALPGDEVEFVGVENPMVKAVLADNPLKGSSTIGGI
jgi:hypothetical protein